MISHTLFQQGAVSYTHKKLTLLSLVSILILLNTIFSNIVYAREDNADLSSHENFVESEGELSLNITVSSLDDSALQPQYGSRTSLFDESDSHSRESYYQAISSQYYEEQADVDASGHHYISVDYKSAEINDVFSNYLGLNVSAYQNQWLNVSGGFYVLLNEKEEFDSTEQDYYLPAFAGVNVEHKNQLFKYMGYSLSFMAAGAPKQALGEEELSLEEQEDKYEIILEPKIGMFFPLSNKTELGVSGGYMMLDKEKATTSYGIDFRLHW